MDTNLASKQTLTQNDIIRTDFILENTFRYLLGKFSNFKAVNAINEREENTFNTLITIINSFRKKVSPIKILYAGLFQNKIKEVTVDSNLLDIASELFSDGISWSRIIAFSVFVGELAILCIKSGQPKSIVHVIYNSYAEIVKEKLEIWISDHNGWEDISSLIVSNQKDSTKQQRIKHIFHFLIRIFDSLCSVTNTFRNSF